MRHVMFRLFICGLTFCCNSSRVLSVSFCELKILPYFEDLNWSVMLLSSWVFMPTEKQHVAGLRPDISQVQYGKRSSEDNDVARIK
jgi:hypothetical protein